MGDHVSQDRNPVSITHHPSSIIHHISVRLLSFVPLVFSCAALLLAFAGLFEWDVPLTRFIRSLNDVHRDHLANPWLAQLSDFGDLLGSGESLVILSLVLLAVGYGFKTPQWK